MNARMIARILGLVLLITAALLLLPSESLSART